MSQRDHCGQKSRFLARAVAKGGGTAGPAPDQGGHHDKVDAWWEHNSAPQTAPTELQPKHHEEV